MENTDPQANLESIFSLYQRKKTRRERLIYLTSTVQPFLQTLDWDVYCKLNWNRIPIATVCMYLREVTFISTSNEYDTNTIWCSILSSLKPNEEITSALQAVDSYNLTLLQRCMNTQFTTRPMQLLINKHKVAVTPFSPELEGRPKSALFDLFEHWFDPRFKKAAKDTASKVLCFLHSIYARDISCSLILQELFFPNVVGGFLTNAMKLFVANLKIALKEENIVNFLYTVVPTYFVNQQTISYATPPGLESNERPSYASITKGE